MTTSKRDRLGSQTTAALAPPPLSLTRQSSAGPRDPSSLFFELVWTARVWSNLSMQRGYDQFCPIAKAAEVVATRWTPLILRELMANNRSFNDIYRGVPLISKAVLTTRLQELEHQGIVERKIRKGGHPEYWLTPA